MTDEELGCLIRAPSADGATVQGISLVRNGSAQPRGERSGSHIPGYEVSLGVGLIWGPLHSRTRCLLLLPGDGGEPCSLSKRMVDVMQEYEAAVVRAMVVLFDMLSS